MVINGVLVTKRIDNTPIFEAIMKTKARKYGYLKGEKKEVKDLPEDVRIYLTEEIKDKYCRK